MTDYRIPAALLADLDRFLEYKNVLIRQTRFEEALQAATDFANRTVALTGQFHPLYATALTAVAECCQLVGQHSEAEHFCESALEIRRVTIGLDHPDYLYNLNYLVALYRRQSKWEVALPLAERAVQLAARPGTDLAIGQLLAQNNLAEIYKQKSDFHLSELLHKKALDLTLGFCDETGKDAATCFAKLGEVQQLGGNLCDADANCRKAIQIFRELGEREDDNYLSALLSLAQICIAQNQLDEAATLLEEFCLTKRRLFGDVHEDVVLGNSLLAQTYELLGRSSDREQAVSLARAGVIHSWSDTGYALKLRRVAHKCMEHNDLVHGLPFLQKAAAILEAHRGVDVIEHAEIRCDLGRVLQHIGDIDSAEAEYRKALALLEPQNSDSGHYSRTLYNLADLCLAAGRLDEADNFLRECASRSIREDGEFSENYGRILEITGRLRLAQGRLDEAEKAYEQARGVLLMLPGAPDLLSLTCKLAFLYQFRGRLSAAETLMRKVETDARKTQGNDLLVALHNSGLLHAVIGNGLRAYRLIREALDMRFRELVAVVSRTSEQQRLRFSDLVRIELHLLVSLLLDFAGELGELRADCFSAVLMTKAIGLDVLAMQRDLAYSGRYPALRSKLASLATLRRKIGEAVLEGPGEADPDAFYSALDRMQEQRLRLEADLAAEVPEMNFGARIECATVSELTKRLPAGAALIEFVRVRHANFRQSVEMPEKEGRDRYVAFVLTPGESDPVDVVDLKEADLIDQAVFSFRKAMTARARYRDHGQRLKALVIEPLLRSLRGRKRIFIAPDSELSTVPFESLPGPETEYWIDEAFISYLTAGRDLLLFDRKPQRSGDAVVVADPEFDLKLGSSQGLADANPQPQRSGGVRTVLPERIEPLTSARREGEHIATLLGTEALCGSKATKGFLQGLSSPRVLHAATHAFFTPDSPRAANDLHGGQLHHARDNPLLRCGLLLAGVEDWRRGTQTPVEFGNGILTAEDVTGMALIDTDIVVLSACETGLGRAHAGEGVYGFRRSFVIAGARTLILSLWRADDQATEFLMKMFYFNLKAGMGKAAALRAAQITARQRYPHPCHWSAFICQGDPGSFIGLAIHKRKDDADEQE